MKQVLATGCASAAALFLLFGTAAQAQREEHGHEAKPAQEHAQQQHSQQQQARPAQQQHAQQQQARPAQQQHAQQQQARPAQQQHAQQQQARPAQQQHAQQQQARPAQQQHAQQQQARPTQQQHAQQQQAHYNVPQRSQQQARGWEQQRGWLKEGGWQGHDSWQGNRARDWQREHRSWDQRGGYGGFYIPIGVFSMTFGDQHWFRFQSRPMIVNGYPRFRYGGYSFMMLDPWPEEFPENWYATDDVYVDYDNGYYLYDRRYPSYRMAISIVL